MGLSLMGTPLVILLAALVVALSVIALVGFPRRRTDESRGRRTTRTSVRVIGLVLSQVMAIALVADVMNRQNAFYVSWGDLLGTAKITATTYAGRVVPPLPDVNKFWRGWRTRHAGHGHGSATLAGSTNPWPSSAQVIKDPFGWTQVNMTILGASSHIWGNISVHLPPGWTAHPKHPYPMIEVLGGYPGSTTTMFRGSGVGQVFQEAVAHHQYRPTIVVGVQTHTARDSECINSNAGQWGTWLAHDVPLWLSQHVGATASRDARSVVGFSMGGWCANMLAVKYPQQFASAVSLGGYMQPTFEGPNPVKLSKSDAAAYNLTHILLSRPPNIRLWLQTDPTDVYSYPSTKVFLTHQVKSPASVTVFVTKGAGHNMGAIAYCLKVAVVWLAKQAPAFAYSKT